MKSSIVEDSSANFLEKLYKWVCNKPAKSPRWPDALEDVWQDFMGKEHETGDLGCFRGC